MDNISDDKIINDNATNNGSNNNTVISRRLEAVSGIMKESVYGMVKALNTEKFGIETIKSINIKIEKWFYETY